MQYAFNGEGYHGLKGELLASFLRGYVRKALRNHFSTVHLLFRFIYSKVSNR